MPSKKTKEEYIEEAKKIHSNRFDYSLVKELPKRDTKVNIICPLHGTFEQSFHKHLQGNSCKKCSKDGVVKGIIEKAKQKFKQEAQLLYKTDGYIKSSNTIFEFHGDFWHGNPELYDENEMNPRVGITYGELYNQTLAKSKIILDKGYNLIEIWENDWKKYITSIKIIQDRWRQRCVKT